MVIFNEQIMPLWAWWTLTGLLGTVYLVAIMCTFLGWPMDWQKKGPYGPYGQTAAPVFFGGTAIITALSSLVAICICLFTGIGTGEELVGWISLLWVLAILITFFFLITLLIGAVIPSTTFLGRIQRRISACL